MTYVLSSRQQLLTCLTMLKRQMAETDLLTEPHVDELPDSELAHQTQASS